MIDEIKEFHRLKFLRYEIFNSPDFISRQDEFENVKKLLNNQLLILIRLGVNFNDQSFKDEDFYPCPICKVTMVKPQKKSWLRNSADIIKKITDYKKIQDAFKDEKLKQIFPKDIPVNIYKELISIGVNEEDINQFDISLGVFISPCKNCI